VAAARVACASGVLPDASGPSLVTLTQATAEPGAVVHTDGLQSYRGLSKLATRRVWNVTGSMAELSRD
jgi:hypothetical protein